MSIRIKQPSSVLSLPDGLDVPSDHEDVRIRPGRRTGLPIVVAIHSTILGPAVGGLRIKSYRTITDAVTDCLRLSAAMTMKAALVDNGTGGGNSVVMLPEGMPAPEGRFREAILLDVAETIQTFDGRYIVMPEVGTTSSDMKVVRRHTPYVAGLDGTTDSTAWGLVYAVLATIEHVWGGHDLEGRHICIVGFGGVGSACAERMIGRGARITASDIDQSRRNAAEERGIAWIADPNEAMRAPCDLLMPCAWGGVLTRGIVPELRCRAIVGGANNQLDRKEVATALQARNILWVPDFVANAGGLLFASGAMLHGLSSHPARDRVQLIGQCVKDILERSRDENTLPVEEAMKIALQHIGHVPINRDYVTPDGCTHCDNEAAEMHQ